MRMKSKSALLGRFFAVILALGAQVHGAGGRQDESAAIQPRQAASYRIDFARHYFADPLTEKSDRAELLSTVQALVKLKGKIAQSAGYLALALETYDRIRVKFFRHYDYLTLRYAVNTKDEAGRDEAYALPPDFCFARLTRYGFLGTPDKSRCSRPAI